MQVGAKLSQIGPHLLAYPRDVGGQGFGARVRACLEAVHAATESQEQRHQDGEQRNADADDGDCFSTHIKPP